VAFNTAEESMTDDNITDYLADLIAPALEEGENGRAVFFKLLLILEQCNSTERIGS
jgi:hypothetical protein